MSSPSTPDAGATLVSLDAARALVGQGRCVCGSGVFRRYGAEDAFACEACGRAKREPEKQPPALVFRCPCSSCLFLVGMAGLVCANCGAGTAFGKLFDAVTGALE